LGLLIHIRSLFQNFKSRDISLIEDSDLKKLLTDVHKLDDLRNGKITCWCCSKTLTMEDLAGFVFIEGEYEFICNEKDCLARVEQI